MKLQQNPGSPSTAIEALDDTLEYSTKKENLYFKKATILFDLKKYKDALNNLNLAKLALANLASKPVESRSVSSLKRDINRLEEELILKCN